MRTLRITLILLLCAGCSSSDNQTPDDSGIPDAGDTDRPGTDPGPGSTGHVVYTLEGRLYRVEARSGAIPEDLSAMLDALSAGSDQWVNLSPDGAWLLISTERFGCAGWACLARMRPDGSDAEAIRTGGELVHADGFSAIASGGERVVYPRTNGTGMELVSIQRDGAGWGSEHILSASSPQPFNDGPALSDDGARALFQCSPVPYGQAGTAVCEANFDGTGLVRIIGPSDGPGGGTDNLVRSPDYAPDGSVVFEADWNAEQIWRLAPGTGSPQRIDGPEIFNDNSPCVLPNGNVASLWLERPEGQGYHELKMMHADGTGEVMLAIDADIADVGLGCGL